MVSSEKDIFPHSSGVYRVGVMCEYLNISECGREKANDIQKDKMIILDKERCLRAADDYESISLEPSAYNVGIFHIS